MKAKIVRLPEGSSILGVETKMTSTSEPHDVPFYDDCSGEIYVLRDSVGLVGLVRTKSWEDAYKICEDEFLPPSPAPGVYSKDINGELLSILTSELALELGLSLEIKLDEQSLSEGCLFYEEIGDSFGVYIPQIFAQSMSDRAFCAQPYHLRQDLLALKKENSPESDLYWERWETVLSDFEFQGRKLMQNGDLRSYSVKEFDSLVGQLDDLSPISNINPFDAIDCIIS